MDTATAKKMCELTAGFYRANSDSFSATREAPWAGWQRLFAASGRLAAACGLAGVAADGAKTDDAKTDDARAKEAAAEGSAGGGGSVSVLDLACGNLRFERFLEDAFPATAFEWHAVDNCADLLPDASLQPGSALSGPLSFYEWDIAGRAIDGLAPMPPDVPLCDIAVSFGFLHHVPAEECRQEVLRALLQHVKPGGYAVVSLWRFLNSDSLAKKAVATTHRALEDLRPQAADGPAECGMGEGEACGRRYDAGGPFLGEGDYLLGWQDTVGSYRYCHHFSDEEIDRLVDAATTGAWPTCSGAGRGELGDAGCGVCASLVDRFSADGRTGNLNEYLVFRRLS